MQGMGNHKPSSTLETTIQAGTLALLALGLFLNMNLGMADNGDYQRSTEWFSSGPVGLESWPAADSPDRPFRFFNYWIPYWKLDFPEEGEERVFSSVLFLWLPGLVLNFLAYHQEIIYLPIVSLFPRLLCIFLVWLFLRWLRSSLPDPSHRTVLSISLGLPLALMLSATEYAGYFNSFYQETASLTFTFLLFATILFLKKDEESAYLRAVCVLAILLLASAKTSNLYWLLITLPFVLPWKKCPRTLALHLSLYLILALAFTGVFYKLTGRSYNREITAYHSLFSGTLPFSNEPRRRLNELGLIGARKCIDTFVFQKVGNQCFLIYEEKMTYLNTVRVLLKEPKVMLSMIRYAAGNMQNFTTRLGTHTRDDPLTEIPTMLQIWGKLKTRTFPREKAFLLTLLLGAVLFTVGVKKGSPYRDLSFLGLLALAGCFIDLFVAIFGDGKQELVKHLFLTNILFDMAAIFALNVITLAILELLAKGEHSKVVGNCRFWGLRAAYAARRPQNRQQPLSAPGKGKSDRIWQRPGKI